MNSIVRCEDCSKPYSDFGLDTTLPNDQWLAIYPDGFHGLLCANCIIERASYLDKIIAVRMNLEFTQIK